jgi:monoamine oxidase
MNFYVQGSQNICTLLAERLQRNNDVLGSARRRIVHLQHVVEAVHDFADLDGPGAVVEASSPAGPISIRARCVIVALSPRLLGRIRFSSPVPRATLGKYWYGGTGVKWTISYRAPFWRAKGILCS